MVYRAASEQNDEGGEEIQMRPIKPTDAEPLPPSPVESPAEDDHRLLVQVEDTTPAEARFDAEVPEASPDYSPLSSHRKPLAFSPTTPSLLTWLVPLLCLATHALFLYGQIAPMWRLSTSRSADVWYNATGRTARWAYSTVGLPSELNIAQESNSTIQTFTYSFAIKELWRAKGMPGLFVPRLAAILLALFSGLWPHLKLVLLNLTWLTMTHPSRRTRVLLWLSCLGKWSLADILVVCVMVGVLHLDWNVDPHAILVGIGENLPQLLSILKSMYSSSSLCSMLLDLHCDQPGSLSNHVKCDACISAVGTAYRKPGWAQSTGKSILSGIETSGDGLFSLRVIGMRGIYAFCAAVVLSILLSLFVDILDHRAKRAAEVTEYAPLMPSECQTTELDDVSDDEDEEKPMVLHNVAAVDVEQGILDDDDNTDMDNSSTSYALLEERQPQEGQSTDELPPRISYFNVEGVINDETAVRISIRWCSCSHAFFSFLVLILATFACTWITLERQVHGAVPKLLHDTLGVVWHKAYSLHTLSLTVGASGGWDYMLMGTFALFIVFGPLMRSSLCVLGHMLPGRLSTIQTFVDLIGAFCAWEVLVIAITMIFLLMPTITNTILLDERCKEIDPDGTCFQVDFDVLRTFVLVLVSGIMLVLISNTFSFFDRR